MKPSKYWEDYEIGAIKKTQNITVTETHLVNWAGLTMDFYSVHMDKEYAAKTGLKERVAHGPLVFGLAVGLVSMEVSSHDSVIAWLGSEVNMILPVFIGDTIGVAYEVIEKNETSKPIKGIQKWLYRVINQKEEVVMEVIMTFLMHRRPN